MSHPTESNSPSTSPFLTSYQQTLNHFAHFPSQRSPVDILLRVFPGRRRSDVEALLQRCKGDVLQAMELMVCGGGVMGEETPSAFSPLPNFHRYSPQHRRFLAAPYAGTGYLGTVIRPPPEYHMPPIHAMHDIQYTNATSTKPTASSPGSNTGSDKTSYSE